MQLHFFWFVCILSFFPMTSFHLHVFTKPLPSSTTFKFTLKLFAIFFPDERQIFRSCFVGQSCRIKKKMELEKLYVLWLAMGSMAFVLELSSAVYEWIVGVLVKFPINKTVEALWKVKLEGKFKETFVNWLNDCAAEIQQKLFPACAVIPSSLLAEEKSWKFSFIDSKTLIFSFMLREERKKEYKAISFGVPVLREALFSFYQIMVVKARKRVTTNLCVHQQLFSTSHKSFLLYIIKEKGNISMGNFSVIQGHEDENKEKECLSSCWECFVLRWLANV